MRLAAIAAASTLAIGLACGPAFAQTGAAVQGQTGVSIGTTLDLNGDGRISAFEAGARSQAQYDAMRGQYETLDRDRFGAGLSLDSDVDTLFGDVDADANAEISRDEYIDWRARTYGDATVETGGEMDADTYGQFESGIGAHIPR